MFCNKCGVAVENNMRKCPQCGHFIKIDKKNTSFEAINDIQYNSESNNNYDKKEYVSSVKSNENSYKNDLEKYRQITESLASSMKSNTENILKINWLVFFILFIISPVFAIIYFLMMTTINKTNGKK